MPLDVPGHVEQGRGEQHARTGDRGEQKEDEALVVAGADAVADPIAMMVEVHDAIVADRAMGAPHRSTHEARATSLQVPEVAVRKQLAPKVCGLWQVCSLWLGMSGESGR